MAVLNGYELVARAIAVEGVKAVFYLMGAPLTPLAEECEKVGVKPILVRHEEGAVRMAHAYARTTASPAVVFSSSGPGAANMLSGLANVAADAAPVVAIGGSSPLNQIGMDAFQEMDQMAMFRPVVKWAAQATIGARIPELISMAFRHAASGKMGPTYIDLPGDVLRQTVDADRAAFPRNYRVDARSLGDPAKIRRALDLLQYAQKPIVISGSGILWSDAAAEMTQFVNTTGIPFFTTPQGRGAVPEDHPRFFPGARSFAFREADVVLTIGARANVILSYMRPPRFNPDAKYIEVNIDQAELGHNVPVEVGILGDAKMVLEQLTDGAKGRFNPVADTPWIDALRKRDTERTEATSALMNSDQVPIHPLRLCREVKDFIERDTILVVDGHEILNFARQSIPTYRLGHRINAGPHGNMGIGIPMAIGAKIARPDSPVVVLTGDGAFGWNGMEIDTAIRYELPLLIVMSNNGGYTATPGHSPLVRYLGYKRYDQVVTALGGHGEFVERPEDIRPALERARAAAIGKPALVNVITDADAGATTNMGFGGYE